MKKKAFAGLLAALVAVFFSIGVDAQNITGQYTQQKLGSVIKEIEHQSGLSVVYRRGEVNADKSVTASFDNTPVQHALESLLGEGFKVEIKGKIVTLSRKESPKRQVTGKVVDEAGNPIPGVFIVSAGTTNGTSTNLYGEFALGGLQEPSELEVSCIGYKTKRLTWNGGPLNVVLEEDTSILDEVVVVGYGTQKKINLTGAISTVSSEDLQNRASLDVAHMLQGAVPGLNITSASGRPGQAATINIRGLNSINGGSPLVLVDGVEGSLQTVNPSDIENISVIKDASSSAVYGARASAGVILVTTKKGSGEDGKATLRYSGRYGFTAPTTSTEWESRGYYSVYLNNLFFSSYSGTPYATYTEEDMVELWNRRNDKVENPERPWVVIDQRSGTDTYNYYANTDWYHFLYNDIKPTSSHSVTMTGGNKNVNYLLSGGYSSEDGMFRANTDVYKRYNLRSKIDFKVNDWLRVSNNTSFYYGIYNYPGVSGVNNAFSLSTVHALASYPVRNPDGSSIYKTQYNGYTLMDGFVTILDNGTFKNEDVTNNLSTTTEVVVTPIKDLEIRGNFTYMFNDVRYVNRSNNTSYSAVPGVILDGKQGLRTGRMENKLTERSNMYRHRSSNVFGTYTKTFGENHNLKVMAGANWETRYIKDVSATGYYLLSETLNDLNLIGSNPFPATEAEAGEKKEVGGGQNEYATMGYFGRINYDYAGKYLFEVSGRYDGTSRFARGQRWGFFPSASAGWRISEEPFFKPLRSWWDNLKIRYSIGQLGNQQVGYYDYIREIQIGSGSYLFGGDNPTIAKIDAPRSSNLTWEVSQQQNAGVDMSFLGNRLTFSAEAYIRDTKNMLTAGVSLPATYGASAPRTNSADLRTKGYELTLSWRDMFSLFGKPFHYGITGIFSDYYSTITRFNNPDKLFSKTYYEGMRYGEIWGYTVDGFFKTDEEAANYPVDQTIVNGIINSSAGSERGLRAGDLKFVDLNGNGKIDIGENSAALDEDGNPKSGDRRIIGNSEPRYNFGLTLDFAWAGFDFSIFFQGIGRMDWYPAADARQFWGPFARPYVTFIPKDFHTMYWTEENPDAYFPRPRGYVAMNTSRELGAVNTKYLQNIGYCRLKNLTVGYTIPQAITGKVGVSNVRFYFTGENLAYFAPGLHSKYVDPEMAMTNGNLRIYPWQKTIMFGIDITF